MTKQPSPFCHNFSHSSLSQSDHVCTRSGTTVQTASSQQQHKIFTSTRTQLSPLIASCSGSAWIPHALPVYRYCQQRHTVFTSTHSHLSPVDSLDVLRVTVLLCVQSDTHRRLWNRQGEWEKLSSDRGFQAF